MNIFKAFLGCIASILPYMCLLNPHKLVNLKPNSPSCQEHCQPDTSARKKYYDKQKLKWSLKYILSLVGIPRLGLPDTSNMAIGQLDMASISGRQKNENCFCCSRGQRLDTQWTVDTRQHTSLTLDTERLRPGNIL